VRVTGDDQPNVPAQSGSAADSLAGSEADEAPTCSARGCQLPAVWVLLWNNPRIHTPDREKSWLACDTHRDTLGEFLNRRGFLRRFEPLDER
jgi:hypothetical protein